MWDKFEVKGKGGGGGGVARDESVKERQRCVISRDVRCVAGVNVASSYI